MKCAGLVFTCLILMFVQCIEPDIREKIPDEISGCIDPTKIDKEAICYMLYQPVCGCDGNTYSNDCIARTNGVVSWTEGECVP